METETQSDPDDDDYQYNEENEQSDDMEDLDETPESNLLSDMEPHRPVLPHVPWMVCITSNPHRHRVTSSWIKAQERNDNRGQTRMMDIDPPMETLLRISAT